MGREKLRKVRKGTGGFPTDALYTLQSLVEDLPERGDRPAVPALHK